MKYLKYFENNIDLPEVGDYVIIDCPNYVLGSNYDEIFHFLNNIKKS